MGSNTLVGFAANNYFDKFQEYQQKMIELIRKNQLKIVLDFGQNTEKGEFFGLQSVVRAIEVLKLIS